MRALVLALLVSLLCILPGCGAEQHAVTDSNAIPEDVIY